MRFGHGGRGARLGNPRLADAAASAKKGMKNFGAFVIMPPYGPHSLIGFFVVVAIFAGIFWGFRWLISHGNRKET